MLLKHRSLFQELISKIVVNRLLVLVIIKPSLMGTDKNSSENSIVVTQDTTQTSPRVRWASSPDREQDLTASLNQLKVRLMRTRGNLAKHIRLKNKLIPKIHLKAKTFS